jgi:DNA-binding transcriptional ArsR family regulator
MEKLESQGFDPMELAAKAPMMAAFLKALGHDGRLAILCHLAIAPKSVSELETLLSSRQPLAMLRLEGLVTARRDGKAIYYSIRDPKVQELLGLLDWRSR